MKHYNSSRILVCDYDHESGKYSISLGGGRFETPSEEVFVNQLHKMLGAPHQSADVALLNKHVTTQRTFVMQHITIRLAYVVRPLDLLLLSHEDASVWPSYYEVSVYDYSSRRIIERSVYRTKDAALKVYRMFESRYANAEFDIISFLD